MSKKRTKDRSNKAEKVIAVIALIVCITVIGYAAKLKAYKPIEYEIGETKTERIKETVSLQNALFTTTEFQLGKVNINTATVTQLQRLEGVGEKRAGDIIAYREQNGPFKSIEEVMNVTGIGEKTFEKFKDDIEV
ncbi:MAG: ComEA family DNA-binding protein [Clostridia bacterium]|nr:ComEA family DNA-binding protein [Clostridia bacterium]